jgi:hypothetical protein
MSSVLHALGQQPAVQAFLTVQLQVVAALLLPLQPGSDAENTAALQSAIASDDCARVLVTALSGALAAHADNIQPQGKAAM